MEELRALQETLKAALDTITNKVNLSKGADATRALSQQLGRTADDFAKTLGDILPKLKGFLKSPAGKTVRKVGKFGGGLGGTLAIAVLGEFLADAISDTNEPICECLERIHSALIEIDSVLNDGFSGENIELGKLTRLQESLATELETVNRGFALQIKQREDEKDDPLGGFAGQRAMEVRNAGLDEEIAEIAAAGAKIGEFFAALNQDIQDQIDSVLANLPEEATSSDSPSATNIISLGEEMTRLINAIETDFAILGENLATICGKIESVLEEIRVPAAPPPAMQPTAIGLAGFTTLSNPVSTRPEGDPKERLG